MSNKDLILRIKSVEGFHRLIINQLATLKDLKDEVRKKKKKKMI